METEDEAMWKRRDGWQAHMKRCMEHAMADPSEVFDFTEHPLPWTWCVAFHDHSFFQFLDANGRPCLGNDLTEPEDAARFLKLINSQSRG